MNAEIPVSNLEFDRLMMRLMKFTLSIILGLLTIVEIAMAQIPADEVPYDENRFEVTVLAEGMPRPMELEVDESGRVYFIELEGRVKMVDPSGGGVKTIGELDVFTGQENGLIGMALDPDFSENRWLYLVYSPREGFIGQHISRFTLSDEMELDMSSEKILLRVPEHRDDCCHHAGSIEFGPDGNLFITTGDNTHPGGDSQGYAPIDERPGRHVYDAQDSSGNTMDLRGKILRIRPTPDGSYTIPPGNLFPPGGPIRGLPEIYVMGCRNPWRMNVDQRTGYLYWGEVGPDAGGDGPKGPRGYDEINQARKAGFFGWPFFIGNNFPYVDWDYETNTPGPKYDPDNPVNISPTSSGSRTLPKPVPAWIYYPYGTSSEFPMMGSGGRTACAGPVYHYDPALESPRRLPAHLDNCLIIYDWQRTFIKFVRLDENSDIVEIQPFLTEVPVRRAVDMKISRDGILHVLDYGETWGNNADSRLLRVDYYRQNRPPEARIAASTTVGRAPLTVQFSAMESSDKDSGDTLEFKWLIGSEQIETGTEASLEYTFTEQGSHNVGVLVGDGHGHTSSAFITVNVGNEPPEVSIFSPQHGGFFEWDTDLELKVSVRDFEDGDSSEQGEWMSRRVLWDTIIHQSSPEKVEELALSGRASGGAGLTMIQHSDCLNCHAVDRKVIGPAFLEIAQRYAGDPEALNRAAGRVISGSSKVWGEVPMLPHSQFTPDEAREMVAWIFSLASDADEDQPRPVQAVATRFRPARPGGSDEADSASLVVRVSYTDLGSGETGPLTASDSIHLRSLKVEGEHHSFSHGTQILGSGTASGGRFIGSISSGHHLVFRDVLLEGLSSVEMRVASPSAGGRVELRADAPDGQILSVVEFKPTGAWEEWVVKSASIADPGRLVDLYCVFVNPAGGGAFMNLDYLKFIR